MVRELGFIVPLENENRWTDLLAVLASNDPSAAADLPRLGDVEGRLMRVVREVDERQGQRVDLHAHVDGRLTTVLEAKVLCGLGPAQLARYEISYQGRRPTCWPTPRGWSSTPAPAHGGVMSVGSRV